MSVLLAAFIGVYGYEQYQIYTEERYRENLQDPLFQQAFREEVMRAKRRERLPQKNELSLAVLVDKEVKGEWERRWLTKNWENHLFAAIDDTSQEFRKEFGMGFSPTTIDVWDSPDEITNGDLLLRYGTMYWAPTDLVLLCTGQAIDGGIAELGGKYALINATYNKWSQRHLIQHEVSHLLGAEHVPDEYFLGFYLMHPQMNWMSTRTWDRENKKRIQKNIKMRLAEKEHAPLSYE